VAFNVELAAPATRTDAQRIAAAIREEAGGPPGPAGDRPVAAGRDCAQVSLNLEDHRRTRLADVIAAIGRHATPVRAELVGLAPAVAFEDFPEELPVAKPEISGGCARRRLNADRCRV